MNVTPGGGPGGPPATRIPLAADSCGCAPTPKEGEQADERGQLILPRSGQRAKGKAVLLPPALVLDMGRSNDPSHAYSQQAMRGKQPPQADCHPPAGAQPTPPGELEIPLPALPMMATKGKGKAKRPAHSHAPQHAAGGHTEEVATRRRRRLRLPQLALPTLTVPTGMGERLPSWLSRLPLFPKPGEESLPKRSNEQSQILLPDADVELPTQIVLPLKIVEQELLERDWPELGLLGSPGDADEPGHRRTVPWVPAVPGGVRGGGGASVDAATRVRLKRPDKAQLMALVVAGIVVPLIVTALIAIATALGVDSAWPF